MKVQDFNAQIAAIKSGDEELARATIDALFASGDLTEKQEAKVEELEQELFPTTDGSNQAKQLKKYRERYQLSVTYAGDKSLNNGDAVAKFLEQKTPDEVCRIADDVCGVEAGWHATKYQKLNLGSQRMNAGNKIRARVKKGEWKLNAEGTKLEKGA